MTFRIGAPVPARSRVCAADPRALPGFAL